MGGFFHDGGGGFHGGGGAVAVVVAASVILADPIFQGLAIALMAGEIASLLISRMAVPVLYFMAYHRRTIHSTDGNN
jgi:hypothetical protein